MQEPQFIRMTSRDEHKDRATSIRQAHPEVVTLAGRCPYTALIGVGLVLVQVGIAVVLKDASPWVAIAAAWLLGAFCVHASFIVVHEACHRLVFGPIWANRLLMLGVNLPLVIPFAIPLGHYHLVHHLALGQAGRDPDLATEWEARLFDRSRFHRLLWQLLFGPLSAVRGGEQRDKLPPTDLWLIANVLLQCIAGVSIGLVLGPVALLYLGASCYFMFALHPLFGRFIQEHFVVNAAQETNSYYGVLNKVSLNFGYHTEHHDFAAVPWFRLPKITRLAPEFYRQRAQHRSWTRLWLRFMLDPAPQLSRRIIRPAQTAPAQVLRANRSRRAAAAIESCRDSR